MENWSKTEIGTDAIELIEDAAMEDYNKCRLEGKEDWYEPYCYAPKIKFDHSDKDIRKLIGFWIYNVVNNRVIKRDAVQEAMPHKLIRVWDI